MPTARSILIYLLVLRKPKPGTRIHIRGHAAVDETTHSVVQENKYRT